MLDYSAPSLMRLRAIGQKLRILRPVVRAYRRVFSKGYEEAYHREVVERVRPGDIVWDIGANEGVYTELFADLVGTAGQVIAFEPSPKTAKKLRDSMGGRPHVSVMEVALSEDNGEAEFFISEESTTDGMQPRQGSAQVLVKVIRGDDLSDVPRPTIIKVDVEGYELEVLRGLRTTLSNCAKLHHVFVEVHFLTLAKRGLKQAPGEISNLLKKAGFDIAWPDASHIVATRRDIPNFIDSPI